MIRIGQILKQARLKKGLTQIETAEKAGISQPYYNLIENDRTRKPPSFYVIERLAKVLQCDPEPLLKSVEFMQLEYKRESVRQFEKRLGEPSLHCPPAIPIVKEIPAQIPKTRDDLPVETIEDFLRIEIHDARAFMLKAKDDCMAPEIKRGDLVLICPSEIEKVKSGDIVAIRNNKGEGELRRVTLYHNQFILTGGKLACPVLIWTTEEDKPKIIGRVKGAIRWF